MLERPIVVLHVGLEALIGLATAGPVDTDGEDLVL